MLRREGSVPLVVMVAAAAGMGGMGLGYAGCGREFKSDVAGGSRGLIQPCVARAPEVEGERAGRAEEAYDRAAHPPLARLVPQEEGGIHMGGALVRHRLGDLVPRRGEEIADAAGWESARVGRRDTGRRSTGEITALR
jgi:hypothetical protein